VCGTVCVCACVRLRFVFIVIVNIRYVIPEAAETSRDQPTTKIFRSYGDGEDNGN